MTTTLRSKVQAELAWTWTDHVDTLPIVDSNRLRSSADLPDGNGSGQADAVWHASGQSLAAGQSVVYELDQLYQDLFGSFIEIPLSAVRAILIVNTTNSGDGYLLVGGAASNAWEQPFGTSGSRIKVPTASPLLLANTQQGWNIPAGQTDLKIEAVAGPVTYNIAVLGTLSASQSSSSSSA